MDDFPEPLYEEIPHPGDLSIVVCAPRLPELYRRAGLALFALLLERPGTEAQAPRQADIRGADPEDLMHAWLSHLLSRFYADREVVGGIRVRQLEPRRIRADLDCAPYARERHGPVREIKAVTFHQLAVRPAGGGWEARVTFDV